MAARSLYPLPLPKALFGDGVRCLVVVFGALLLLLIMLLLLLSMPMSPPLGSILAVFRTIGVTGESRDIKVFGVCDRPEGPDSTILPVTAAAAVATVVVPVVDEDEAVVDVRCDLEACILALIANKSFPFPPPRRPVAG